MGGNGSGKVVRASLLASLLWLLFICILANQATEEAAIRISSTRNLNVLTFVGSKRLHRGGLNLNSVSKRRVPNGPDPIHNRRARNSREPPTRA